MVSKESIFNLEGKVAAVTGGGSGLGREFAKFSPSTEPILYAWMSAWNAGRKLVPIWKNSMGIRRSRWNLTCPNTIK